MYKIYSLVFCLMVFFNIDSFSQVSLSTLSTFESGLDGWTEGSPSSNPPEIVASGGPAGNEDGFVRNTSSGGSSAGGRWVMYNRSSAWTGNFQELGTVQISMDVRNSGSNDIHLRIGFQSGTDQIVSQAIAISPSAEWTNISFEISSDQFTSVAGSKSLDEILANVSEVRLLNNMSASWRGSQTAASLDLDNIQVSSLEIEFPFSHMAFLTGRHQLKPVETLASGRIYAYVSGDTLQVAGVISGITSSIDTSVLGGIHIHQGVQGQNGSVVFPLKAQFFDDMKSAQLTYEENTFIMTPEQRMDLENFGLYINVHSKDYPSGEIRGQITPYASHVYSANLFGSYQSPAVMSEGYGSVLFTILQDSFLVVSGTFKDIEGGFDTTNGTAKATLQLALPGPLLGIEVGELTVDFDSTSTTGVFKIDDNIFNITPAFIDLLENRELNINIASDLYSETGEIKGHLVPASSKMTFRAHLSAAEQFPMPFSLGTGIVMAEVMENDSIAFYGSYYNLTDSLATNISGGIHVHRSLPGRNGSVVMPLKNTSQRFDGIIEFSENKYDGHSNGLLQDLMNRSLYVNVHSTNFAPSGEIRGQFLGDAQQHYTIPLSNAQSLAASVSTAQGLIKGELIGDQLILSGSFKGLTSEVATELNGGVHIHLGSPGQNGSVLFPVSVDLDMDNRGGSILPENNRFTLSQEQIQWLKDRKFYVNIHSKNNPSGEIRGQFLYEPLVVMMSVLSGSQENPPVNTKATGFVFGEINNVSVQFFGSFNQLDAPIAVNMLGGMHLHNEKTGSDGQVIIPIAFNSDTSLLGGVIEVQDNLFALSNPVLSAFLSRDLYFNVHSEQHTMGEIRGQMVPYAQVLLQANLSGENASPKNSSSAYGAVIFEYNDGFITGTGSFNDLSSSLATQTRGGVHIHRGYVGSNGGIVANLVSFIDTLMMSGTFEAWDNAFSLGISDQETFLNGGFYVNVHSMDYGAGEIRGQILPMINYFPDASTAQLENPAIETIDTASTDVSTLNISWTSGQDRDRLAYQWQWSTTETFDSLLFESDLIQDTFQNISSKRLLDTLVSFGYFESMMDSACLYQRLWVTDGSLSGVGPVEQICFVQGIVSSLIEDPLKKVTKIGPNPAQHEINLRIDHYTEFYKQPNLQIQIIDLTGKTLRSFDRRLTGPHFQEWINIQDLSPGTYFLRVNQAAWPFIKQ